MYDPMQGRFLSPDNHIQDPFNTQNFNRFGYVLNNPLSLTDPSGEFFWVAVAFGAFFGGASAAMQGGNFWDILGGALIGGIAAGAAAGLSNLAAGALGFTSTGGAAVGFFGNAALSVSGFGAGFTVGFVGGFAGGFVGATGNALMKGQKFGKSLLMGLKAGFFSGVVAGVTAGVTAGIKASKNGRDFWNNKPNLTGKGDLKAITFDEFVAAEEKIKWDVDVEMDIPYSEQAGDFGCSYSCKSSVDKYFGTSGQEKVNTKWLSMTNSGQRNLKVLSGNLESYYNAAGYNTSDFTGVFSNKSLSWISSQMKSNHVVHVSWYSQGTGGMGHASLISRIQYMSDFSKYRIFIMDPNYINPQRFNLSKTYEMFSIWKN